MAPDVGNELFRGYRSLTVGFSGLLGIFAASIQTTWVASPQEDLDDYLKLWFIVAMLSLTIVGIELFHKAFTSGSGLVKQMTLSAIGRFLLVSLWEHFSHLAIFRGAT
ncbi:MAG: hypothetical protein R3C11_03670 [Planctomycetaceae bacterium]